MGGFRPVIPGGGGGGAGGGTTYGALTNAQILAIASPSDLENAFSTDDDVIYTYNSGSWYNPVGGVLS